ncbi:site-specific integrase [Bacteroides thetaiotaomicron]|uniref:Site-specific integrase n=1 Tax=Bacteroides thetaiotaomicron TaxID=818 RepID=A0AAW4ZGG9_BACT4|nr:site-specific integrase [Bacteroides thetaiotaomicron]MCE9269522.1 site-specific integrase [Bacteroides thetaiotaomicron]MCE9279147.1 site-specific integrase [Bacteroides thetaiotaomicron]MCE9293376.1 site-specific integrase [Bacteroides thetaiotaomicron]
MKATLSVSYSVREAKPRKDYVNHFRQSKPLEGIYFTTFAKEILEKRSRRKSEHYAAVYDAIIKHIDNFSEEFDCDIFTNSVTAEFLDDFIIYLEDQGLRHNTIVGYILKIQSLIRRASQYNYAVDVTYDEIDLKCEPTNAVFLSMNEITRIYYYKFEKQDKRKAKEKIRDMFVLGCLTALRYSDYSRLTSQNLVNGYIVIRTKKTNVDVKVPAHDYVKEIFAKYNGQIPSGLCIQYFNKYLKVIMREIGLNDLVTYSFTKGGELKTVTREKWELVSSHTARRSAATNMYLTGRMKTLEIMKLTGHRTEQNFFLYIRLTADDTARSISGDMFFRK